MRRPCVETAVAAAVCRSASVDSGTECARTPPARTVTFPVDCRCDSRPTDRTRLHAVTDKRSKSAQIYIHTGLKNPKNPFLTSSHCRRRKEGRDSYVPCPLADHKKYSSPGGEGTPRLTPCSSLWVLLGSGICWQLNPGFLKPNFVYSFWFFLSKISFKLLEWAPLLSTSSK